MGNVTAGGQTIDDRSRAIKHMRGGYEIQTLRNSITKQEIDIKEALLNIERIQESIAATEERIQIKQAELDKFEGGEING